MVLRWKSTERSEGTQEWKGRKERDGGIGRVKQAEPGLGGKIKRRGTLHQTYGVALPSGARVHVYSV